MTKGEDLLMALVRLLLAKGIITQEELEKAIEEVREEKWLRRQPGYSLEEILGKDAGDVRKFIRRRMEEVGDSERGRLSKEVMRMVYGEVEVSGFVSALYRKAIIDRIKELLTERITRQGRFRVEDLKCMHAALRLLGYPRRGVIEKLGKAVEELERREA